MSKRDSRVTLAVLYLAFAGIAFGAAILGNAVEWRYFWLEFVFGLTVAITVLFGPIAVLLALDVLFGG